MKNLTWQNPEQLFVAQELINKVKSKCCGIKDNLEKNDYVEIISGRFAGVRGYYARPFKDKCVVCVVEGLAVCTTYIPAYALKIIEKGK